MITSAQLSIDRAAAGLDPEVENVPAYQWELRFFELAPLCPSIRYPQKGIDYPFQRNALRSEIIPSAGRCLEQSPDGRGLAWMWSGGSVLAYGCCALSTCPRAIQPEVA